MTSDQQELGNIDSQKTGSVNDTLVPEDIPENWDVLEVQDLLERVSSRVEPDKMDSQNYVSLKHMGKSDPRLSEFGDAKEVSSQKYEFASGDILFGKLRPYFRKVALTRSDGICSTDINVIRPTDVVNRDFLFYMVFRQDFIDIADKTSTGTRMPRADWRKLDEMRVALPPLGEQKKISRILYQIDTKIELNNRVNRILEEMAKALFNSWFVNFERYDKFKQSELGERPANFEVLELGDVCSTRGGGTPSTDKDEYWGGDNLWLTPKEVTSLDSKIVFDTERKVTEEGLNNSSTAIMPEKSVLLTSRATVGEVVVNREPMGTNQGFICIQPNDRAEPYYLACLVESKRPEIENRASGSTYDEISQTSFNGIQVAVPPKEDIEEFEKKVEEIYEDIYTRELENRRLEELRDTLLPKLMSGEIRVNDIELDELEVDSEV